MELKEGMYVRTKSEIVQINKILNGVMEDTKGHLHFGDFIKASYNIIDLIEVGDYVNGEYVTNVVSNHSYIGISREFIMIKEEDIKSIVTKEQFESMQYEIN